MSVSVMAYIAMGCAGLGIMGLVISLVRRSQRLGAIQDASEAIGLIESAEAMRDEALRGNLKDARALDEALDKADKARKFIEENQDKIKKESSSATLDRLARLGY